MRDEGTGPAVIVVPGVQGRWEWMEPALRELQRTCRVISYSPHGGAVSAAAGAPARFDTYIEQLDEVFERAGVQRAALCGVSYGGFIALRYAARRPERVAALRRAFDATMKDPAFLAEAEKLKIDIDPLTGEQLAALVREVARTPAETVARVRSALEQR